MTNQKILITGGAGYIGSHVTKILQKIGCQTLVLDNLSRGNSQCLNQNTVFIEGDIGDEIVLSQIFEDHQIDAVMHFAAFIDVGESIHHPMIYYHNNVTQTLTLLRTMLRYQIKKFIFSSSAAVYGLPKTTTIDETHPCSPINPYGLSKWMIEKILTDFDRAYGFKSCCLRYFNAAGGDPEGKIKNYQSYTSNLIPLILKNLKSQRPITIFGNDYSTPDGTCIRDYIHIEDLGKAHVLGMQKLWKDNSSCLYNLGNGRGYSVKEVIEAVKRVTGQPVPVINGERRAGDPPILVANAQKAVRELQWSPQFADLDSMIEHAWKAFNYD